MFAFSFQSLLLLLISLLLFFSKCVIGDEEVWIKNESDFSSFLDDINNKGLTYSGTTVYLDSDLSLPNVNESIGKDSTYQFQGTFDGQGYIISDLIINSSSTYTGLFGYSEGSTIRNVILDSSCSITNFYTNSFDVGGIIGSCYANNGDCIVENNVNMASVTFTGGTTSHSLYLGGIVGYISSIEDYSVYVKNCINYGGVTHSGISSDSYIGGIVGYLTSYYTKYIYNCFSYGPITHNGTTSTHLYIGGITGYAFSSYIKNCVSAGKTVISGTFKYNTTGGIVSFINSDITIHHCYFTSDSGMDRLYQYEYSAPNIESSPIYSVDVDLIIIDDLNSQKTLINEYNKWVFNKNNNTVTFKVNNNKGFSFSSQIILLPDLISDDNSDITFSGWYTDIYYNNAFKSDEVTKSTTLYSLYGEIVTVSFKANGGNVDVTSKKVIWKNIFGILPTPTRTEAIFDGWFTEKNESVTSDTIVNIADDYILYAHWTINNYTITFIFDNGTNSEIRTFEYNSLVTYPDGPVREGYIFNGWNKSDINVMPAENLTIMALWTPNNYTVTFNLNGGDSIDKQSMNVTFNNTYGKLPTPIREGYTFDGWLNDKNESVTSDTIVNTANNHILYAQWIVNNYTITFVFDNGSDPEIKIFEYNLPVTYPDDLLREGHTFGGWNKSGVNFMPAENLTIAALWIANNYTVTFDLNGGDSIDKESINVTFNSTYGILPTPTRTEAMFNGWFNEKGESVTSDTIVNTANNHILYAQWTINNYTITFVFDNGSDPEIKMFEYNSPVIYPDDPVKEGYTFDGWSNDTIGFMPAENIIITAQWKEVPTTQVEIIFDTKDITEEEIKIILEKYTNDGFTIIKIINSEMGETKVIIEFTDVEKAEEFVKSIRTLSRSAAESKIKRVGFGARNITSFSLLLYPLLFSNILI